MSLEATKQQLSRKYLGQAGIHGIGISRRQNAIRVHVATSGHPARTAEQEAILDALKRDASTYPVLIVTEDRATTFNPVGSGADE